MRFGLTVQKAAEGHLLLLATYPLKERERENVSETPGVL